ncbi:hypothetical protein Trydic_g19169 [Trypoxylus dichotomus]
MEALVLKLVFIVQLLENTVSLPESNVTCSEDDTDRLLCSTIDYSKLTKQCLDSYGHLGYTSFCYEKINIGSSLQNGDQCLYITEPKPFNSGCPSYDNRKCVANTTNYTWIGKKGGENNSCIVKGPDNAELVSCESLYSHVCLYRRDHQQASKNDIFDVEISLWFDEQRREIFLTVYSPDKVYSLEDDIRCFTYRYDLADEKFKKIDIDEVFNYAIEGGDFNSRNFTVFKLDIRDKPNEYWCKILVRDSGVVLTTHKQVGFRDDVGNEFVMYLQTTIRDKFPKDHLKDIIKFCKQLKVGCRAFELIDFNEKNYTSNFLIHLTMKSERIDRNSIMGEYSFLKNKFKSEDRFNVVNLLSAEWCLPTENETVSWPIAHVGAVVMSSELCFTDDGMIAFRKCEGNFFYGSRWGDFHKDCLVGLSPPEKTTFLFNAVHGVITNETVKNVSLLINDSQDLSIMEISFLSLILYETSLSFDNLHGISDYFYETINNLFNINSYKLKTAQILLNSTDVILNALDIYMCKYSESKLGTNHLYKRVKKNLIIHVTKPFLNGVSGIAIYGNSDSFLDYTIVDLYANMTKVAIDLNNLEVATLVPNKLLDCLARNLTEEEKMNFTVITTIFANDSMFNEDTAENSNISVGSKVINVLIPGFGTYLEYPLPLLLRRNENTTSENCGYWAYGKNNQDMKGKWSTTGVTYREELSDTKIMFCTFSHLTHFALLVSGYRRAGSHNDTSSSISEVYYFELTIITVVSSAMSVIGILGIFLTALLYSAWRKKPGTKFLLHLSTSILLEMALMHIADSDSNDHILCMVVGILLHYVVLSKFAWMLVIAFLQYLRFVRVLGPIPPNLLLKSMLVGWVSPMLPVLLTVVIFPDSYTMGKFCYPKGIAMYTGLLIPAILIISANISVFILVMKAIHSFKGVKYDKSGKMMRRQVCLAVLLFFLLGIHWVFGILAAILPETWLVVIFTFLFCITTGLQGFTLFTFYVVLDKETRKLWTNSIKSCL